MADAVSSGGAHTRYRTCTSRVGTGWAQMTKPCSIFLPQPRPVLRTCSQSWHSSKHGLPGHLPPLFRLAPGSSARRERVSVAYMAQARLDSRLGAWLLSIGRKGRRKTSRLGSGITCGINAKQTNSSSRHALVRLCSLEVSVVQSSSHGLCHRVSRTRSHPLTRTSSVQVSHQHHDLWWKRQSPMTNESLSGCLTRDRNEPGQVLLHVNPVPDIERTTSGSTT